MQEYWDVYEIIDIDYRITVAESPEKILRIQ
jgi:hypothetical protein